MKNLIGLILGIGLLTACSAHEVDITYNCVPSGATVYEEGIGLVGTCPVTLGYSPYDDKVSDGKLHTDPIKVVWMSGASLMVPPMAVEIPSDRKASVTFMHPPGDTSGILSDARDARFAIAYEQSLPTPERRYVATSGEDKSIFDAFNGSVTCAFDALTENISARCP